MGYAGIIYCIFYQWTCQVRGPLTTVCNASSTWHIYIHDYDHSCTKDRAFDHGSLCHERGLDIGATKLYTTVVSSTG